MIATHGLTHLNLEVADPDISLAFYRELFGVREYFRDDHSVQVLGPGEHDVIAFVRSDNAGAQGGLSHFGFRLQRAEDIDEAVRAAKQAGAEIIDVGEFEPGEPYLYLRDPDGYLIEVWFE